LEVKKASHGSDEGINPKVLYSYEREEVIKIKAMTGVKSGGLLAGLSLR
jgi:hypothetical protein